LVIGISQSGETSDTITAIRQAKSVGSHVLIITNRPDSIMAREAHSLIPVNAGIEVSVAATKSFNAQLIALYLFAIYIAEIKESCNVEEITALKQEMLTLPQKIELTNQSMTL
jgi:glucosamine--fructose-6-phosphate aminotransferase (isomerizing)